MVTSTGTEGTRGIPVAVGAKAERTFQDGCASKKNVAASTYGVIVDESMCLARDLESLTFTRTYDIALTVAGAIFYQ